MDVVEVSPPFDHAEVTAMAAHRVVLEAVSALAARHRDGHPVRFDPAGAAAAEAPTG
jgi:agmatinase